MELKFLMLDNKRSDEKLQEEQRLKIHTALFPFGSLGNCNAEASNMLPNHIAYGSNLDWTREFAKSRSSFLQKTNNNLRSCKKSIILRNLGDFY